ncbi:MAG: indolepyruvate ferredoxin oxidoreductase subunit alpha [Deltaproteobacteria bacterium]|nr:indolepyruvate ferredoxin oxidoreductase subunit alpha [Deltaproteobacteria bacterium]
MIVKELLSGNEAIARGALECGVAFGAGYPGTPSTEILEAFAKYEGVYAEWAPNEKVALETAIGASLAGVRAIAVMKHVGVNVAADPLFTVSYTGVRGGLVIVTADDPSMHSSQNEQDNRNYARFAKIPMIEPADSQEAKDFVRLAFEISERFDTPVFLRSTTRVSHSKSVTTIAEPDKPGGNASVLRNPEKYVMVPAMARLRRIEVEKRMAALAEYAETFHENKVEFNDLKIGIISSGMPYNYAKDAFPKASFLKLGMVYPLPVQMIRDFASAVENLYVVEELDPFFEDQIKALGIEVRGKTLLPRTNEFDPTIVCTSLSSGEKATREAPPDISIPPRPPNLCPGCPHRGLFYVAGKLDAFVAGDIGCYTLSYMKPLRGLDSCICMGASFGMAHGMSKALGSKGKGRVIGVIGDSTFVHSGITPLLNASYNKSDALFIICDNATTAMTGMQDHPGTGRTLQGLPSYRIDFIQLAQALGIEDVHTVNPFNISETKEILKASLEREGPSLVISKEPCALLKTQKKKARRPLMVDIDKCIGCKLCLGLNCPPISWKNVTGGFDGPLTAQGKPRKGFAVIDSALCNGCSLCMQVCSAKAIKEVVANG